MLLAKQSVPPDSDATMKKKTAPLVPFEAGQIWEWEGARVQIGMVGKLLVHYRHYRTKTHGVPTSLSSKAQLQVFLRKKKAVLLAAE